MKNRYFIIGILLSLLLSFFLSSPAFAEQVQLEITPPIPCGRSIGTGSCNSEFNNVYKNPGEKCVETYTEFKEAPETLHFWAEDPEVTTQGKADERARQFIAWVLSKSAIDDHPALKNIWQLSRNIAYFLVILVAAVLGIGFIVGQRAKFELKIQVWPALFKIGGALLYITLSASIVLILIQISEVLMKFFIENLGADKLFNIYFADAASGEKSYVDFIGCRDLNLRVQESARTGLFLLKLTNITYYLMGIMIVLRKIILWFMLFVSPFLAVLLPFALIRNIGFIWIGVFFQWLFYGPLFALFLGAIAKIWRDGIPFVFDFSRANSPAGYIYPTAVNITYAGPSHQPLLLNNGNYIDTFAEYVITLIMLWAAIFFPWWLLRIFRDYCCDGIYAIKNILLSKYDQMRGTPPGPSPLPTPMPSTIDTSIATAKAVSIPVTLKLETLEEIKKTKTVDIARSMNLTATKLTDIARFETNRQTQETVRRNIDYLSNPTKATTPTERQRYMNIRTELFNRAVKEDVIAKQILIATSPSRFEQVEKRKELLQSIPQAASITAQPKQITLTSAFIDSVLSNNQTLNTVAEHTQTSLEQVQQVLNVYKTHTTTVAQTPLVDAVAQETGMQKEKVTAIIKEVEQLFSNRINDSIVDTVATNAPAVSAIAQTTQMTPQQVQTILTSYKYHRGKPSIQVVDAIVQETGLQKEKVGEVMKQAGTVVKTNKQLTAEIAQKEQVPQTEVEKAVEQITIIAEPAQYIEKTITIPPTVSIEDYEEVRKMWIQHYEKGEVPVTENIPSRSQWVEQDIVFITNTLNKLLSADEQTKLQGFDEVGYILPMFMINNLKGEELLVYLKAKLEAAKQVQSQIEKEKEIEARLKAKTEEVFVETPQVKQEEAAKTMSVEAPLPKDPSETSGDNPTNPER